MRNRFLLAASLPLLFIACEQTPTQRAQHGYFKSEASRLSPNSIAKAEAIDKRLQPEAINGLADVTVRGISSNRRMKRQLGKLRKPADSTAFDTEEYQPIVENPFLGVTYNPLSTFSIDVDQASYTNVRRFINQGTLPPPGAVRIEEMVNYFEYNYPRPQGDDPFSVNTEIAVCPWNQQHRLARIGLKGREIPVQDLPAANLVFLIDVSGSMEEPNKLPLVQASLSMLTDQLRSRDRVAIVVYAGQAGLVLPSTSGDDKSRIKEAINGLSAGGSTAGGEGIQLAYKVAKQNFITGGNNRVILSTDGDFNVGLSSDAALVSMIENERKSGVFLSVLGYGMGNYKDSKMQQLADKGNGNHAYIDNIGEARKVLVSEFGSTLFTIAKDVKIQVEFNPAKVQSYRLIGYENRMLAAEDFKDDTKDAGELGSGHVVTALYEIIPSGITDSFTSIQPDSLKYQTAHTRTSPSNGDEIMTIKLRYKKPAEETSNLIVKAVRDQALPLEQTSGDFRFSAAVAEFGLLLRKSAFRQQASFSQTLMLARDATGDDTHGYRAEFVKLVQTAGTLAVAKNSYFYSMDKKRLVILTGAGISAESGLRTFRDSDGPLGRIPGDRSRNAGAWHRDPQLVLDFYNMRRRDVKKAEPNPAHLGLAALENDFDVHIITQNIDDLHERAGSTKVMHLHGEIFKMRSQEDESLVYPIFDDITLGQLAADGAQLRPNIVWFEEPVPMIAEAIPIVRSADIFIVVGTSLVVYPAAGLLDFARPHIPKFIVDKKIPYTSSVRNLTAIEEPASTGVQTLREKLAALV